MLLLSLAHLQNETYLTRKAFDSSQLCQVTCTGLDLQPDNVHHHLFDLFSLNCISILLLLCRGDWDKQSFWHSSLLTAQVLEWCNKKEQREKINLQYLKKKENRKRGNMDLLSKADIFRCPMGNPRGRGEGEGRLK